MTIKTKSKRGAAIRMILIEGVATKVQTLAALAKACGIARITIKRVWEQIGALPSPTFVSVDRVRWYSDAYIGEAAETVRIWRKTPRGRRELVQLAQLMAQRFKAKGIR